MKKLIVSICSLILAFTLLGTSTYAWFSMNKTAKADGMQVKAVSSASLVISASKPDSSTISTAYSFTGDAKVLTPATAVLDGSSKQDFTTSYAYGLKTLTTAAQEKVSAETGFASAAFEAEDFTEVSGNNYNDFVLYIAASGDTMAGQQLVVTFDAGTVETISGWTDKEDTKKAVTIAVFAQVKTENGSITEIASKPTTGTDDVNAFLAEEKSAFKGNLVMNNASSSVTLFESVDIPKNELGTNDEVSKEQYIKVTLRVYIDGALEKTSGHAYVNTNTIDVTALTFGVKFTASNAA